MVRQYYKRLCLKALVRRAIEPDAGNMGRSAIVFSPHFDDETLGCGGTIIKKIQAGARIVIVFMTDGTASHRYMAHEETLKRMRSAEGLNAALDLGLEEENIVFLGLKEGAVEADLERAAKGVIRLIERYEPDEVFVPHHKEPLLWSSDHRETTRIVKQSLSKLGAHSLILEYPVWYWYHWPWVGMDIRERNFRRAIFINSLVNWFGMRSRNDFNYGIPVSDVLCQKKRALQEHKSQMTRIVPERRWITLTDISDGEFLTNFFQSHELFYRSVFHG
jgi:LmbE family N-acetylglucosaminyl deacetylase